MALAVAEHLASRPIAAIYASPSKRTIETVEPLAARLGLALTLAADLRERELPVVAPDEFLGLVEQAWRSPSESPRGGESNIAAQRRGVAIVREVLSRHAGSHVVLSTHGNLLALVLNALDSRFGYEFWSRMSFPDIYRLTFESGQLRDVERTWKP